MFNLNKLLNRKSEESRSPSRSESLIYNAEENADRKSGSAEGFLCPSCYLAFPTAELLQNHYESSHPEGTVGTAGDGRGAFNCPDCKMKLGSEIELQSHYKRHHSTSKDQVEVEALKMQVTALQEGKALVLNEIQALRSQVPDLLKENSKIKEHRDSLEQRAAMLAGDVANLKAAFDEVNSKKSSLESELKKAQEKIQDFEIEIQQRPEADDVSLLRQEIVSVQKMMDKQTLQREAEKDALQKQCSTLQELCKRLEAEKCALETSLKTAPKRNDVESLQAKVSNMKSRITELQGNMDLMAANNVELTSAIENCADYEDVKRELVEKEVLLQDCTKSLEAKDEIIKMLNSDLKCEKEAIERMKAGAEKLFSKIVEGEGASTAIDQLKEENCRLQEQFLHQQKITVQVTQEMESKLADFQLEIKQVKAEVQVYQDKCTELEKELSSFKSKLQTCSLEKENLAVQVENHKENFSGMESTYKAHRTALQEELEGYKVRLNENVQSYVLLKNKVEESEKIQCKLLEEKAELQNRIDSLVKEISETTSQLKLLVSEKEIRIGEMENNLAEFISKYSQKEEENYIINMQMKELKKSYEEVIYKLEEAQQQIANVEAAKLECVEKLNNAEKELLKCQENVEQLTLSFVNLNEVKMQLSEKVIVYDKETSELISVVDSLTKEKDSISNQLQSLTTEFIEMKQLSTFQEKKISELTESYQNEKESRSREVQDLENAKQLLINQKVAQLKELEKVKEEKETEITGFRNNLKKMETELQSSTIKYKTLAAKLIEADKSANQSKEEWENREAHFQAQIGVLSENAQTLREDLLAEHNKRETLDQKCDELSGNKLELEAKLENALDERRALLDRCLKSESECEKLQRTSADLRRKLDDTVAALQELGRENQTLQIENSKHMGRKWADDAEVTHCTACGILFTVTLRKHHCRNCGNIFCNECSSKNTVVAASKRPVRVCDMCYTEMSK